MGRPTITRSSPNMDFCRAHFLATNGPTYSVLRADGWRKRRESKQELRIDVSNGDAWVRFKAMSIYSDGNGKKDASTKKIMSINPHHYYSMLMATSHESHRNVSVASSFLLLETQRPFCEESKV